MARPCKHGIDLTNFNCEKCASEYASAFPQDKKPWPAEPTFRVYAGENDWVCELDCYVGHGKTVGRAIDAAITTALGAGRSLSVREWVRSHYYLISAVSTEESEGDDDE
jgi:hypothetical protein